MDNSGSPRPSPELLRRCGYIFGAEILIDITKHAVLSKLNDIRPAVYQRFMRVRMCPELSVLVILKSAPLVVREIWQSIF